MPIINGKFYMNPAAGSALERARAADATNSAGSSTAAPSSAASRDSQGRFVPPGPIHRVEIDATDGGFVANVHRKPQGLPQSVGQPGGQPPPPTTHVFADHNDLAQFLLGELSKQ